MEPRMVTLVKVVGWIVAAGVLVGISAAAMPHVQQWLKPHDPNAPSAAKDANAADLVPDKPNTLRLPSDVEKALGVRTEEVKKANQPRPLEMSGSLGPDTDHLLPIRPRFAGEVVELRKVSDREDSGPTVFRPLRTGDVVHEGDLLAVVWSKDLGEKKSELLDAVSRLRLDQDRLERMDRLYAKGGVTEQSLREAERNVDADRIAVSKAELTLRSWRLTEKEIQPIYEEAKRISDPSKPRDKDEWKKWARVEVWAPFDGTILEKNITQGAIVDTTTNLFIIGDLRRLSVVAYPYEEELPAIQALQAASGPIHWKIHVKADPSHVLKGTLTEIRPLIDPNMHTGLIKGYVDNPDGRLLQGQYITVTIDLPPDPSEVVIPTAALVEDGQESIVFVQDDPSKSEYTLRHVMVSRRSRDLVYIRSKLRPAEERRGLQSLRPGERVVIVSPLEMRAALRDLQDAAKTAAK